MEACPEGERLFLHVHYNRHVEFEGRHGGLESSRGPEEGKPAGLLDNGQTIDLRVKSSLGRFQLNVPELGGLTTESKFAGAFPPAYYWRGGGSRCGDELNLDLKLTPLFDNVAFEEVDLGRSELGIENA